MYKNIVFLDGVQTDFLQSIEEFIHEWENDSTYIEVKTSGSTGEPKKIILDKADVIASAKGTGKFFGLKKNGSLLLNLSPDYIAGKLMIVRAIVHEMNIIVVPLVSRKSGPWVIYSCILQQVSLHDFTTTSR